MRELVAMEFIFDKMKPQLNVEAKQSFYLSYHKSNTNTSGSSVSCLLLCDSITGILTAECDTRRPLHRLQIRYKNTSFRYAARLCVKCIHT